MDRITVDQVLANISIQLHLSKETENEVLEEIRTHLEDAINDAAAKGWDEEMALQQAAKDFGVEETGAELQEVHGNWESIEAVGAVALPVLCAVVFRWLAFAPDGTALHWPQPLVRPGFIIVAAAALLVPLLLFRRWRYALVIWGIFWLLTVVFIVFPSINQW